MGVRGKRTRRIEDEPTLLGDIDSIVREAIDDGHIEGRSINVRSLVNAHNLGIKEEDLSPTVSGKLIKEDDQWEIIVNKNHHERRKRFTIAHEFAHYCLHKSESNEFEDTTFFRDQNSSSIEYKANEFASEILMPKQLFDSAINDGIVTLSSLSKEFYVSIQAAKYRATALGYSFDRNDEPTIK